MIKEENGCAHGNDGSKCGKYPIIQRNDKILWIHGKRHIVQERQNEKMKRKITKSNRNIK